jgi:2,3-diaminopropionate biosynthesis protein SbnA
MGSRTSNRADLASRLAALGRLFRPTPVVRLEEPDCELYAKLEFFNPIGSVKDRPAYWVLKAAADRGELTESTTVVESSSGNYAMALASLCRLLELRFVPVIDPAILHGYEVFLRGACERVVKVDRRDDTGGYLKTRLEAVNALCIEMKDVFWTRQYENEDGVEAHYRLTGGEIATDFQDLDLVFIGISSGSTIAGVSQRLKERFPAAKVIAVDAEGSVIFGGPPAPRRIPGIGSSIVPPLLARARIDDVVVVPEREAAQGCRDLLLRHGLFAGGSSGASYAAIQRYAARSRGPRKPRVLFLCADRGTQYIQTVFDRRWNSLSLEAT